ncbi:hypothetical protein SAMN05216199_2707 [Pedococcus cremeus]|uniref:Holin n=1 Tax=Pedococcus cremeus TaxID=587636 RepID=A0A1H9W0T7_9MICO|nr:hypothetical protein [Pedococcus cremeus]SES27576.1 hypothetical protein SAMN05216199_2707 [Pedococcus cremeus]
MSTTNTVDTNTHRAARTHTDETRTHTDETRPARKTTELIAYVAAVLAVALTALVVGDDGDNTADPFSAEQALRYITFLTIGYMIARGLAKSGSRGRVDDNN